MSWQGGGGRGGGARGEVTRRQGYEKGTVYTKLLVQFEFINFWGWSEATHVQTED